MLDTFEKFAQGAVEDYRVKLSQYLEMNHVEAAVVGMVAKLFPDEFGALAAFCERHQDFLDPTIRRFDREVQFYRSYLDYLDQFTDAGLKFCYPQVSDTGKEVRHHILDHATGHSVIIFNGAFTSTTLEDAVFLGTEVLRRIIDLGALCVCVTFVEELASLGEATVSMVSTVVPEDPATRTFRVIRRPADGRAYAVTLAEKYRLTYEHIAERIPS